MTERLLALESFDTERGPIIAGQLYEAEEISDAGLFVRLRGHSAYVRIAHFAPLAKKPKGKAP